MKLFTKKKSTMKKRPSFVSTKQRIVAVFTVTMMLLQICLPTVAWAASLLSNENITAAMASQAFRKSSSNSHLYEQASFDDASDIGSQNIKTFRQRLVAAKTNLGKPTFVPIGSDITIFVPTYPTGKLIGDAYVQNRYIRQQVFDLLGRHLIYASSSDTSEISQINTLYDNAFTFAKANPTLDFGANLSSTTLANLATDMIWPEIRVINNESVVVPILYLTTSTINGNKVTKTTTEFTGASASIGSVTLDHATLTLGAKTMLTTKNNITLNKDSLLASGGDVNLVVGGTLNLIGSKITGVKDVNIIAKEINVKAVVIPFQDRYGSGTKLGSVSDVNSSTGNIFIRSTGGDITFEGSTATASNGSINLDSAKNISIQPVFLSYQGDGSYGAWIIDKSSVNIVGSKLSARDTISLYAEGAITITSSQLISTQGGIELLAQQGIYILDAQGNTQVNRQKIKGRTQGTSSDFNTWAVRSVLSAGKGVLMDTAEGDITLRAAQISSTEGTGVYARNGKVHLLVTKEQSQYYLNMVKKGTWTIKTRTVEQNNETAVPNSIVGGFKVEALHGVDVEYTGIVDSNGKPIEDLDLQMDAYKNMPELAWMADLRSNPNVSASWNQIKLIKINKDDTSRQLSPAAMAIIAIAVAVATGGGGAALLSGSSITGAAAGTTWAAVSNAAFTTLVTQASSSLLAGNSLSQTLKNMSSEDSLKSLAISMVTAGAMQHTDLEMFKVAENAPTTVITLAQQAGQAVVNATVQAGVSVAISGGNTDQFKAAFKQGFMMSAANSITQVLAQKIGDAAHLPEDQRISVGAQYLAHAALGCLRGTLTAKINGSDAESACYSGSGGALIGEAVGKYYASRLNKDVTDWANAQLSHTGQWPSDKERFGQLELLRLRGADIAQLTAAVAAFASGGNADTAASSAKNSAQNNALELSFVLNAYKTYQENATVREYVNNTAAWWTNEVDNIFTQANKEQVARLIQYREELDRQFSAGEIGLWTYNTLKQNNDFALAGAGVVPTTNGDYVLLGLEGAGTVASILKFSKVTKADGMLDIDASLNIGNETFDVSKNIDQLEVPTINSVPSTSIEQEFVDRIAELRSKLPDNKTSGNMGVANIDVPGLPSEMVGYSRVQSPTINQQSQGFVGLVPETFPSIFVESKAGVFIFRDTDSEAKILNNIALQLGENKSATGSIKLFTERAPCASCSNTIQSFKQMFPNIDIEIFDNAGKVVKPK